MATDPLLPSYADEKRPSSPTNSSTSMDLDAKHEDDFNGLHLGGGQRTLAERFRGRVAGLSKVQKVLLAAGLGWVGLHAVGRLAHGHGHHRHGSVEWHGPEHGHGHRMEDFDFTAWRDDEHAKPVTAEYAAALISSDGRSTANATFPLSAVGEKHKLRKHHPDNDDEDDEPKRHHGRHHFRPQKPVAFDFASGVEAGMVVSVADVEVPTVIVESTWTGVRDVDVEMKKSCKGQYFSIPSSESASHILHLVLPLSARRVPPLHISSPSLLPLSFHSSAESLQFSHLAMQTDAEFDLPEIIMAHSAKIETVSGDVGGKFNVTKALVLKTVTGDITAEVFVKPLHHGPPHNGTHPPHHKGGPKHDKPEHDDDEENKPSEQPEELEADDDEDDAETVVDESIEKREQHKSRRSHGRTKRAPRPHHHARRNYERSVWSRIVKKITNRFHSRKSHGDDKHDHPHPHPPHHGHDHGHGPHHPPPPPVFIGTFTITGAIDLTVHQPPFVSTVTKAISHTGNVTVNGAKTFKGLFVAETHVGNVSVGADSAKKEIKVLKEVVTPVGAKIVGIVHFQGNHSKGMDNDDAEVPDFDVEEHDEFPPRDGPEHGGPSPHPPHRGPGGPPPHPPHRGPGGPPPPPHKGPGGPPHPPPHKGPGGPPGGPGGPHGPHGHHRPPPPGHSKVIAKTETGSIKLSL